MLRNLLRWPYTWAAAGAVCALEAAFVAAFRPGLPMLGGSLALGLALLALWPACAVRSPAFLARHHASLDVASSDALARLAQLERDLLAVDAAQGLEQLRMFRHKLDALTGVLQRRMNAGELTFGRYLGTAEQVYLAALDNLHEIVVVLTSAGGIDREYIGRRLAELEAARGTGADQVRERDTLNERHRLLERQLAKVAGLYAQNEAAMTTLDNTAMALAETRTGKGRATVDAEAAMAQLEDLAKRTGKYAATI